MTEQTRTALKGLQRLDTRIVEARQRIRDFDPRFEEVEEPALILERDLTTTRGRLKEMKLEERRLELATEEKRARVKRLDERLGSVRNLREEAAVSSELDMVKRALQSDEQEAYTLLDQIRKLDEREAELAAAHEEAQGLVAPRMQDLVDERERVKTEFAALEAERVGFVQKIDPAELRLYDGIRAGGTRLAVANLTTDGACGSCFGIIPLQLQNEIRHGSSLIRCEGCGVILASPDPDEEEPGAPAAPDAAPEVEEAEAAAEAEGVADAMEAAQTEDVQQVADIVEVEEAEQPTGAGTHSDEMPKPARADASPVE